MYQNNKSYCTIEVLKAFLFPKGYTLKMWLRTRSLKAMNFCSGSSGMRCIGVVCAVMLTLNYLLFIYSKAVTPFTVGESLRYMRVAGSSPLNAYDQGPNNTSLVSNMDAALILEPFDTDKQGIKRVGGEAAPSYNKLLGDTVASPPEPPSKDLPACPEKPPNLVGSIKTHLDPISMVEVEDKYPQVRLGGHYRPSDCRAKQKLAIVIPCRNRDYHLAILLHNLVGFLIKQQLDFSIFVIDQEEPTTFNRGMLFNIGFLEAMKRGDYTCFVFHDVDMIPTNDNCIYRCSHHPRHYLTGVSKWNYNLPYPGYYGGVVGFSKEQYEKINGDSNLYFGWGGEDDDLKFRVLSKGYKLVRYPKPIGLYDTMNHKRDKGNKENNKRFKLLNQAQARQDEEGLNTTKYKVTEVIERRLFTRIKAYINMTQILQAAPLNITEANWHTLFAGHAYYIENGMPGKNSTIVKLVPPVEPVQETQPQSEGKISEKETSSKAGDKPKESAQQDKAKTNKNETTLSRVEQWGSG